MYRPSVDPERLCFGVQDAKMEVVLGLATLPQRPTWGWDEVEKRGGKQTIWVIFGQVPGYLSMGAAAQVPVGC